MKTDNIEKYLNSFGKQVVNRAKGSLQKAKGGGTNLEKSISFKVVTDADGFSGATEGTIGSVEQA